MRGIAYSEYPETALVEAALGETVGVLRSAPTTPLADKVAYFLSSSLRPCWTGRATTACRDRADVGRRGHGGVAMRPDR
jgi:hypothetical protein